jgi:hypothetical protein
MKFVVCIEKPVMGEFSNDDVTTGHIYEILNEEAHGFIRLIDDSGEDYLYPEKFFDAVSMQASTEKRIHELSLAE